MHEGRGEVRGRTNTRALMLVISLNASQYVPILYTSRQSIYLLSKITSFSWCARQKNIEPKSRQKKRQVKQRWLVVKYSIKQRLITYSYTDSCNNLHTHKHIPPPPPPTPRTVIVHHICLRCSLQVKTLNVLRAILRFPLNVMDI